MKGSIDNDTGDTWSFASLAEAVGFLLISKANKFLVIGDKGYDLVVS